MPESPFPGAFPHQHDDPRGLRERIEAQLRERIEEAVELAALHLMVELRRAHQRPAPDTSSVRDRQEFEATARDLLAHLRQRFEAELPADRRADYEAIAQAGGDERGRALAGLVFLARRLPDFWERFEAHRLAHEEARRAAPPPTPGLLGRLFGSG